MAKVPFDCFAFICLFVRNRKDREKKVSYLVYIRSGMYVQ